MNIGDLIKMGADMIRNNSDDATTGLDLGDIVSALGGILGAGNGSFDLGSLLSAASSKNLTDILGSWIGSGQNAVISAEGIIDLFGREKVEEFARMLGISEESACGASAEAVPQIVDRATPPDGGVFDELLQQSGGVGGLVSVFGKMFG